MSLPKLSTSKALYLPKFQFYNFRIYLITSKYAKLIMHTWIENVASKDSLEIASCFHNSANTSLEIKNK